MAEPLTREQFRSAVSDAVDGVLNVYREVDAMLRELAAALADQAPPFVPLGKRVVPGVGKNPDARYLRNYHASIFVPADISDDEDDEEEDDDEDGLDEDEADGNGRKPRKPLAIGVGSGVLIARATIFDRGAHGFEPNLSVVALTRCGIDVDVAPGTQLRMSRQRIRRVLRALEGYRGSASKRFNTGVTVQVVGKSKARHRLLFDVPQSPQAYPLYEVTPEKVLDVAASLRQAWLVSYPG